VVVFRVKIVLLVKFEHSQLTIILEKWEEEACVAPRAGAMMPRYAATIGT